MDNRSFVVFTSETSATYTYQEMISDSKILEGIFEGPVGVYFSADTDTDKINIVINENEKIIIKKNGTILSKGCFLLYHNDLISIEKNGKEIFILFFEKGCEVKNKLLKIEEGKTITIGRSERCDIIIRNSAVSKEHAKITVSSGSVNFSSVNHSIIYLNGIKKEKGDLQKGDNIRIVNCQIFFLGSALCVTGEFEAKYAETVELKAFEIKGKDNAETLSKIEFSPMPRVYRSANKESFKIDPPPAKNEQKPVPFILSVGPSLTMSLGMLVSVAVSVGNIVNDGISGTFITSSFMALSMLLGALLWPFLLRSYNKKQKAAYEEECAKKYTAYLEEKETEISEVYDENREIISRYCLRSVEKLCSALDENKAESFLWERDCDDDDFLTIRIGKGFLPSGLKFSVPEKHFVINESELEENARKIAGKYSSYDNAPIGISLCSNNVIGIFGKNRHSETIINNIIANIAILHSAKKVKIAFIFPNKSTVGNYNIYKDIPHMWNSEKSVRYFACSKKESETVLSEIYNKVNVPDGIESEPVNEHYVVFAWDIGTVERSALYQTVKKDRENKNVSFVFLSREYGKLSQECSTIIQCSKELYGLYIKNQNDNRVIKFVPDCCDEKLFAKAIKRLKMLDISEENKSKTIPQKATFLDMFKAGNIAALNIGGRWHKGVSGQTLATPIGVTANNEVVNFDIHEAAHGCHGIVAGTTGSGKSEFLQTYILSMMVNYSPEDVNFILIDFKGGDIATPFLNLPHLSAVVSNLSKNVLYRAMISLEAEQIRRQKLFERKKLELNLDKIDINLYQKLYHAGKIKEALPHLIIIMDEFAQFKTQHNEYMQKLINIAQIGRSLGIHLILATQKPSGVVDGQIWSNSRFKFCLKVLEREDSKAVLQRDEAAFIKNPGAGYMQIGYNEIFTQFQSGYCRAKYVEKENYCNPEDITVSLIDSTGKVISEQMDIGEESKASKETQINEIIKELEKISEKYAFRQNPLWLPELKRTVYADDCPDKENGSLRFAVGIMDLPGEQKQSWLMHDFIKDGNIALFGASGMGKTTFVQSLLYQGVSGFTPNQFRYGIIDLGGKNYSAFDKNEYCIGCAFDKENGLDELFENLENEFEQRKNIISENGCASFVEFKKKKSDGLPVLVIILENYAKFREEAYEYERRIIDAVNSGAALGVYFIVTSSSKGGIYSKVKEQLSKTFVFSMAESDAYREILGVKTETDLNGIKGRAFVQTGNGVVEIQIALPIKNEKSLGYLDVLEKNLKKYFEKTEKVGSKIHKEEITAHFEKKLFEEKETGKIVPQSKETLNINSCDFKKAFLCGKNISDLPPIFEKILEKYSDAKIWDITGKEEDLKKALPEMEQSLGEGKKTVAIISDFVQMYKDISDADLEIFKQFIRKNPELICITSAEESAVFDYIDTELYINLCKKAQMLVFAGGKFDFKKAIILNENIGKFSSFVFSENLKKDECLLLYEEKFKKLNLGRDQ